MVISYDHYKISGILGKKTGIITLSKKILFLVTLNNQSESLFEVKSVFLFLDYENTVLLFSWGLLKKHFVHKFAFQALCHYYDI